jgi:hypothetical protein
MEGDDHKTNVVWGDQLRGSSRARCAPPVPGRCQPDQVLVDLWCPVVRHQVEDRDAYDGEEAGVDHDHGAELR